eukprot:TRINITY_DN20481_c0_g3_i1.p1 TRINITY_DN20481_c0_g3~~TRINITY_DN20481_c0_g3_i1.p1  ORF type:complete len:548 (-),score=48.62 TRINITY_DN20481_c0_g3_i1:172-1815(-)
MLHSSAWTADHLIATGIIILLLPGAWSCLCTFVLGGRKVLLLGSKGDIFKRENEEPPECDDLKEQADRELKQRSINNMTEITRNLEQACDAFLLTMLFNIVLQRPRWMNTTQSLLIILIDMVLHALRLPLFDNLVKTGRGRDMVYALLNVILLAHFLCAKGAMKQDASWIVGFVPRLLLNGSQTSPKLGFACNAAYVVLTPFFSEHVGDLASYPILREIIVLQVFWYQTRSTYQLSWNEIYQSLKAESLLVVTRAHRSLLDLVCDVVVELDSNLLLTEGSEALKAIFGSPKSFTKGSALPPLFGKQDGERLSRHFRNADSTLSSGVGSFSAQIKDSFGVPINIDLVYISFDSMADGKHYLVGLREFTDLKAPEDFTKNNSRNTVSSQGKSWKGTPSVLDSKQLSDGASTSEMSPGRKLSTSSAAFQATLSCSCLKPTNDYIKLHSVKRLLLQWNIQMDRRACCPLHAHIHECMCTLKKLKRESCLDKDSFAIQMGDDQCTRCGMVTYDRLDSEAEANADGINDSCIWCSSCTSSRLQSLSSVKGGSE